jgi:hypothetical protein
MYVVSYYDGQRELYDELKLFIISAWGGLVSEICGWSKLNDNDLLRVPDLEERIDLLQAGLDGGDKPLALQHVQLQLQLLVFHLGPILRHRFSRNSSGKPYSVKFEFAAVTKNGFLNG